MLMYIQRDSLRTRAIISFGIQHISLISTLGEAAYDVQYQFWVRNCRFSRIVFYTEITWQFRKLASNVRNLWANSYCQSNSDATTWLPLQGRPKAPSSSSPNPVPIKLPGRPSRQGSVTRPRDLVSVLWPFQVLVMSSPLRCTILLLMMIKMLILILRIQTMWQLFRSFFLFIDLVYSSSVLPST